jgi:predicted nucleic acid-binding protein
MGWKSGIRAVLDTSVLLGVHRNALLRFAAGDDYTIVWSAYIVQELQRKFREMGWRPEKAAMLFDFIDQIAVKVDHELIGGGNYDEWLLDVDDHPIIATAIAGRVDYLVTANTKDFPPKKQFAGITMITPDAFLRLLESKMQ